MSISTHEPRRNEGAADYRSDSFEAPTAQPNLTRNPNPTPKKTSLKRKEQGREGEDDGRMTEAFKTINDSPGIQSLPSTVLRCRVSPR